MTTRSMTTIEGQSFSEMYVGKRAEESFYQYDQFNDIKIRDTQFIKCEFFAHAALHSLFSNCTFSECTFKATEYPASEFLKCEFHDCHFSAVDYRKTYITGCLFENCCFEDCSIRRANLSSRFSRCKFFGVDFTVSDADGSEFTNCSFKRIAIDFSTWDEDDYSYGEAPYTFFLSNGLEGSRDEDGTLSENIGFMFHRINELREFFDERAKREKGFNLSAALAKVARVEKGVRGAISQLAFEAKDKTQLVHASTRLQSEFIQFVSKNDINIFKLSSRDFERLVAEVLNELGYQVELTAATRDGGYDIFAVQTGQGGISSSMIIECKRYRPDRKVGLDIVRSLYSLRCQMGVGAAMLATTSGFSKDAERYQNAYWDLNFADSGKILEWCRSTRS